MKLRILAEAYHDVEAIAVYIAKDNPVRAIAFSRELLEEAHNVSDLPQGYPLVLRYKESGIRRKVYRNYAIFYRILDDIIEVMRVIHTARDYEALLDKDGLQ